MLKCQNFSFPWQVQPLETMQPRQDVVDSMQGQVQIEMGQIVPLDIAPSKNEILQSHVDMLQQLHLAQQQVEQETQAQVKDESKEGGETVSGNGKINKSKSKQCC